MRSTRKLLAAVLAAAMFCSALFVDISGTGRAVAAQIKDGAVGNIRFTAQDGSVMATVDVGGAKGRMLVVSGYNVNGQLMAIDVDTKNESGMETLTASVSSGYSRITASVVERFGGRLLTPVAVYTPGTGGEETPVEREINKKTERMGRSGGGIDSGDFIADYPSAADWYREYGEDNSVDMVRLKLSKPVSGNNNIWQYEPAGSYGNGNLEAYNNCIKPEDGDFVHYRTMVALKPANPNTGNSMFLDLRGYRYNATTGNVGSYELGYLKIRKGEYAEVERGYTSGSTAWNTVGALRAVDFVFTTDEANPRFNKIDIVAENKTGQAMSWIFVNGQLAIVNKFNVLDGGTWRLGGHFIQLKNNHFSAGDILWAGFDENLPGHTLYSDCTLWDIMRDLGILESDAYDASVLIKSSNLKMFMKDQNFKRQTNNQYHGSGVNISYTDQDTAVIKAGAAGDAPQYAARMFDAFYPDDEDFPEGVSKILVSFNQKIENFGDGQLQYRTNYGGNDELGLSFSNTNQILEAVVAGKTTLLEKAASEKVKVDMLYDLDNHTNYYWVDGKFVGLYQDESGNSFSDMKIYAKAGAQINISDWQITMYDETKDLNLLLESLGGIVSGDAPLVACTGETDDDEVAVLISDSGVTVDELNTALLSGNNEILEKIIYFGYIQANDGKVNAMIPLKDSAKRKYMLAFGDEIYTIGYIAEGEKPALVSEAKTALNEGNMESFLTENAVYLCDAKMYGVLSNPTKASNFVLELLKDATLTEDEASVEKLGNAIDTAVLIQALNEGYAVDFEDVRNKTAGVPMEIPLSEAKIASDKLPQVVQKMLRKEFTTVAEYGEVLSESIFIGVINDSEGLSSADKRAFFNTYAEKVGLNLTKYNNLTSNEKTTVITKLAAKDAETISDMQTELDALCNDISSGTPGGKKTGGGGSSGRQKGVTGMISIPTTPIETIEPKTELEKEPERSEMIGFEWAQTAIDALQAGGIIVGYADGSFKPSNNVTRAEFITMLARKYLPEYTGEEVVFDDVTTDKWYYKTVMQAYQCGIVNGANDNSFMAESNISRQDAAVIISRMIAYMGKDGGNAEGSFTDDEDISDYAKEAVYSLKSLGILNGDNTGAFRPMAYTNRAEAAKLIYSCIQYIGEGASN